MSGTRNLIIYYFFLQSPLHTLFHTSNLLPVCCSQWLFFFSTGTVVSFRAIKFGMARIISSLSVVCACISNISTGFDAASFTIFTFFGDYDESS